jgi:hypothetical protein
MYSVSHSVSQVLSPESQYLQIKRMKRIATVLEPYNNPFWDFSYGVEKKEREKINTKKWPSGLLKLATLGAFTSLEQMFQG